MTHTEYRTGLAEVALEPAERQAVAQGLGRLLADTYTLYLKTHNFHWNVTGPMFATLHLMFEQQYQELATAVDVIAERIRALEHPAPGTYAAYAELSSIEEDAGVPRATDMIRLLLEAHGAVTRTLREVAAVAERAEDHATMDLVTQRLAVHEKNAWMLRSLLE